MSLAIKYELVDDANMRLRNTIVLYKGEPVVITQIVAGGGGKDDIFRVLFKPVPLVNGVKEKPFDPFDEKQKAEQQRKYISSKHFDIAPFKLGYVNSFDKIGAFYCSRLPNRVQKQGLCQENFKGVYNSGAPVHYNNFLVAKEVANMVAGKYPSFDKALELLNKCPAVAFHREYCLVKDEVIPNLVFLYHKGVKVGMYTKNAKEVSLGNKFNCLRESLQELNLRVGVV